MNRHFVYRVPDSDRVRALKSSKILKIILESSEFLLASLINIACKCRYGMETIDDRKRHPAGDAKDIFQTGNI